MRNTLMAIGLVMLVGCAGTPEQWIQDAADIAQFCAYNASEVYLLEADDKAVATSKLREVSNDLRALETADKVSMADLILLINRLPADKLKSPYGRIAIINGTLVLIRLGRSSDLADKDLKPVATGLREGIESVIGLPPILTGVPVFTEPGQ